MPTRRPSVTRPRSSEFASYVFIRNDLEKLGWDIRNPGRCPTGQVYTQQECLNNPDIAIGLQRQRPEYVVKVNEDTFWVIEAKGSIGEIETAIEEAVEYAKSINRPGQISAFLATGVAGNETEGYLVRTFTVSSDGSQNEVVYNTRQLTGFLSPSQARDLVDNQTHKLNDLVTDEAFLLAIAEEINNELHVASINKDLRATVMSAVLLAMVSDTLPDFNSEPNVLVNDINNRVEYVLIGHEKREFAQHIKLALPHENAAKERYKAAVVKVFFLLRKINVKAAMNSGLDLLGKFYEVFLKYGNGAKDIGIVLTPRHITEFSSRILSVNSTDLVLDPACGTGGFLVAAYDTVRKNEPDKLEMFKKNRIFGVELQANVAALAIVNMIFRGDGKNHIKNGDCFALNLNQNVRDDEVSAEYQSNASRTPPVTKVLMNPPFSLRSIDERESRFIEHALRQMRTGGLLLSIVPVSVVCSGGKDDLAWRRRLLENNSLLCVISLPDDLFYPQAAVETVIVVIKKGIRHENNTRTLFARITDDGFAKQKRKRLPHGRSGQLAVLEEKIKSFIQGNSIEEVGGVIQVKMIDIGDASGEWSPQEYLDSPELDISKLKTSLGVLYSEMVFQKIRRGIAQC